MVNEKELLADTLQEYAKSVIHNIACTSAHVEAEGYCAWTRIEEIIALARRAKYKRIGLAYCIGLRREADRFSTIMTENGFEMVSVICKAGASPKETLGLSDEDKVGPGGFEATCNPIAQARLLNKTECWPIIR